MSYIIWYTAISFVPYFLYLFIFQFSTEQNKIGHNIHEKQK